MNNEQNKKHYTAPAMEEIALNHCASLLDGSGEELEEFNGEFGLLGNGTSKMEA